MLSNILMGALVTFVKWVVLHCFVWITSLTHITVDVASNANFCVEALLSSLLLKALRTGTDEGLQKLAVRGHHHTVYHVALPKGVPPHITAKMEHNFRALLYNEICKLLAEEGGQDEPGKFASFYTKQLERENHSKQHRGRSRQPSIFK